MRYRKPNTKLDISFGCYNITSSAALALAACGSGSGTTGRETKGFPKSYVPPEASYEVPKILDPNFKVLSAVYTEPYWIQALEMHQREIQISPIFTKYDRIIEYTFPNIQPEYNHYDVIGWQPSTDQMKVAARELFQKLDKILDVSFVEGNESASNNIISIGRSLQTKSSGLSFFPNKDHEIGMDIFISGEYSNPHYVSDTLTNYDYEVLVHELGHALGLKHPFEESGTNAVVLSSNEDNSLNTAMSYNWDVETFNGDLRFLDWMALTKFYGVKATYNEDDNTYNFSSLNGTFIIDGAGIDTINVENTSVDATIDLRQGAHSHLGSKSNYITDINQLTISHGSDIENVKLGSGDDVVIGNNLDNVIITGTGNDTVFTGEGSDIVNLGSGYDRVDLSEDIEARDTVIFNQDSFGIGFDTIYGFVQGPFGDILKIGDFFDPVPELFPLVVSGSAPVANFSSGILRVIGDGLITAEEVSQAFEIKNGLAELTVSNGEQALIITSATQDTGADQCFFHAKNRGESMEITKLAVFVGNALDIDQWHLDNFSFIA